MVRAKTHKKTKVLIYKKSTYTRSGEIYNKQSNNNNNKFIARNFP